MKNLFNFSAARHELANLCDIPAGERTPEQTARHQALTDTVSRMKALVQLAECLKAATKSRIVTVVYADGDDQTAMGEVEFRLADTGIVIKTCPCNAAAEAVANMLIGARLAA